jgi:hypothetical protein
MRSNQTHKSKKRKVNDTRHEDIEGETTYSYRYRYRRGDNVQIHSFLNSALDKGQSSTSLSGRFNPGKEPQYYRIGSQQLGGMLNYMFSERLKCGASVCLLRMPLKSVKI